MNQPTTATIIKTIGQLLSDARELKELKAELNRDYASADIAQWKERLNQAQCLLNQLCQNPVLAPTAWNPYPEVKPPTADRNYLAWVKDGGAGWRDQPIIVQFSSRLQDFEGDAPILEDGGVITHWAEITAPEGCAE